MDLEVIEMRFTWVKVFRINSEFRILRLPFHRKSKAVLAYCAIGSQPQNAELGRFIVASLINFQII